MPIWAKCITACLREESFSMIWKKAYLVLLKKPGKPDNEPSSFRFVFWMKQGSSWSRSYRPGSGKLSARAGAFSPFISGCGEDARRCLPLAQYS